MWTEKCKYTIYFQKKKKINTWTHCKPFPVEVLARGKSGTFNDRQRIMAASPLDQIKRINPYKIEKQKRFSFEVI